MKQNMKVAAILLVSIAALLITATVIAAEFKDHSAAAWVLSPPSSYDPCNTQETGRVCAEWRSPTQSYGLTCCISAFAVGTSDPGACEILIDGQLGFLPGRDID